MANNGVQEGKNLVARGGHGFHFIYTVVKPKTLENLPTISKILVWVCYQRSTFLPHTTGAHNSTAPCKHFSFTTKFDRIPSCVLVVCKWKVSRGVKLYNLGFFLHLCFSFVFSCPSFRYMSFSVSTCLHHTCNLKAEGGCSAPPHMHEIHSCSDSHFLVPFCAQLHTLLIHSASKKHKRKCQTTSLSNSARNLFKTCVCTCTASLLPFCLLLIVSYCKGSTWNPCLQSLPKLEASWQGKNGMAVCPVFTTSGGMEQKCET